MLSAHFTRSFCAAHRVWNDPGLCGNIHGHNYTAEIQVDADSVTEEGFVVPFDRVKAVVDHFDHALVLDCDDPIWEDIEGSSVIGMLRLREVAGLPSTEFMAQLLADGVADATRKVNPGASIVSVKVLLREGPSIAATATSERPDH